MVCVLLVEAREALSPIQEGSALLTEAELIEIYREHAGPLYGFVSRRVGGDRSLAEDIVSAGGTLLSEVPSTGGALPPDHARLA